MTYKIKLFIPLWFVVCILAGCGGKVHPGPAVGTFISRNINIQNPGSPHDWLPAGIVSTDLVATISGTTLNGTYGDVGGLEELGFAGSMRSSLPPALGVRGSNDYLMAFSEYDNLFSTPATSQNIFATTPSVTTGGTFTWPTNTAGYFSAGSGLGYNYTMAPIITQVYSGAGILGFLAKSTVGAIGASTHELYAWVRAENSNVWIGDAGGTAKASLVSGATVAGVEPRGYGAYLPHFSYDYGGGFLASWLGRDSTLAYSLKPYRPFSGWGTLTYPGLVANTMVAGAGNPDPRSMTYGSGISPSVGMGMAAEFLPDGTGDAWVVQVVADLSGDYSLHKTYFDGLLGGFRATTEPLVNAPLRPSLLTTLTGTEAIYTPEMYVDSSGNFTVFYVVTSAPGVATGTVYYVTYNKASGIVSSPTVASVTNATFDYSTARADAGSGLAYGEIPKIIMKKSPNNEKIMVAYATTGNSVMVLKYNGTQFIDWDEVVSPTGFPAYSIDGAINDSGDAVLVAGFQDSVDPTLGKIYGFRALASYNSGAWNEGTALLPPEGDCLLETLKISVVLDNNSHGLAAMTCAPIIGGVSYMTRNLTVPFR